MKFSGNYNFHNKIDTIWEKLNDPKILKKCITGCKQFIEKESNIFFLVIEVRIGPVNATFSGTLKIKEVNAPNSYTIEASGNAGQLGGARGNVSVILNEKNSVTNLSYHANTSINGKIAQLGSRLIEGTVKKNTTSFFKNFENLCKEINLENKKIELKESSAIENKNITSNLNIRYIYFFIIIFIFVLFFLIYYE